MKAVTKSLLAAAVGTGILALTSATASADLACRGNVCWHVHKRFHYPPKAGVVIHPDKWRRGPNIVIREHKGRGYWHGDRWIEW